MPLILGQLPSSSSYPAQEEEEIWEG